MENIVFATNNIHKLKEVTDILQSDDYRIISLKDIGCHDDIPETSSTLEGNALQKARYIYNKYRMNCFSDDTGLEVNALGGVPGIYSARFAGEQKSSEDNMNLLLKKLQGVSDRSAHFRTVIALILEGKELLFEGKIKGFITEEKDGTNGFGYDPIFIPEGYSQTFASLGDHIKNKISHRAKAIQNLCNYLNRR